MALFGVQELISVTDQRKRRAQLFHETRPLTGLPIPNILYGSSLTPSIIYRGCPERDPIYQG